MLKEESRMGFELSETARSLLRMRYLRRDEEGKVIKMRRNCFGELLELCLLQKMPSPKPKGQRRLLSNSLR